MEDQLQELARQLGERLKWQEQTVVLAESCTGGWIAKCLTDVAGCSAWFERGYVTYSLQSKTECLDVPQQLMIDHGTVSAEVAVAEARGALLNSGADWAICATGVAGPGGATVAKPVGLVHFCWMSASQSLSHHEFFRGDRQSIRAQATAVAMQGLIQLL